MSNARSGRSGASLVWAHAPVIPSELRTTCPEPPPAEPSAQCGTKPPWGAWSFYDSVASGALAPSAAASPTAVPHVTWARPSPRARRADVALGPIEAQTLVLRVKRVLGLRNVDVAHHLGVSLGCVDCWSSGRSGMRHASYVQLLAMLEATQPPVARTP